MSNSILKFLSNLFRRKGQRHSSWRNIGRIEYGNIKGSIPKWVLSEEWRIRKRYGGGSSGLVDLVFYLKGRRFEYRLSFGGQGAPMVYVDRRKRRGKGS